MEKLVKPAVRCHSCGNIKHQARYRAFCDSCNKKLKYDRDKGWPFQIDFAHDEVNCAACPDGLRHGHLTFVFCSMTCGAKWFFTKAAAVLSRHKPKPTATQLNELRFLNWYLHEKDICAFQDAMRLAARRR